MKNKSLRKLNVKWRNYILVRSELINRNTYCTEYYYLFVFFGSLQYSGD